MKDYEEDPVIIAVEIKTAPEDASFKGFYRIRFVGGSLLNVKEDISNCIPNPNGFVKCQQMEYDTWSVKREGEGYYSRVNGWKVTNNVQVNINQILSITPIKAEVIE